MCIPIHFWLSCKIQNTLFFVCVLVLGSLGNGDKNGTKSDSFTPIARLFSKCSKVEKIAEKSRKMSQKQKREHFIDGEARVWVKEVKTFIPSAQLVFPSVQWCKKRHLCAQTLQIWLKSLMHTDPKSKILFKIFSDKKSRKKLGKNIKKTLQQKNNNRKKNRFLQHFGTNIFRKNYLFWFSVQGTHDWWQPNSTHRNEEDIKFCISKVAAKERS